MKNKIINLLLIFLFIPFITEAKVWRVNNNETVIADFATLDDAMSAYAAGDTIHLEPSTVGYTVTNNIFFTTNKFVTIIGNGYFHIENSPLQQDNRKSMIVSTQSNITLNADIKFIGVVFNSPLVMIQLSGPQYVHNITFESCFFTSGAGFYNPDTGIPSHITEVHFKKNYIANEVSIVTDPNPGNLLYNFSFENNIILGTFKIDPVPTYHDVLIIRNNIFGSDYTCFEAYWANNIFTNATAFDPSGFNGSTLKNNIFARPVFTTNATVELNNQFDIPASSVLVSNPAFFDRAYELLNGSVAIGAGIPNGSEPVDCGAYGGPDPYKPNGMPAIPSISELNVPPSVLEGGNIHIGVKSVSNN